MTNGDELIAALKAAEGKKVTLHTRDPEIMMKLLEEGNDFDLADVAMISMTVTIGKAQSVSGENTTLIVEE